MEIDIDVFVTYLRSLNAGLHNKLSEENGQEERKWYIDRHNKLTKILMEVNVEYYNQ